MGDLRCLDTYDEVFNYETTSVVHNLRWCLNFCYPVFLFSKINPITRYHYFYKKKKATVFFFLNWLWASEFMCCTCWLIVWLYAECILCPSYIFKEMWWRYNWGREEDGGIVDCSLPLVVQSRDPLTVLHLWVLLGSSAILEHYNNFIYIMDETWNRVSTVM